MPCDAPMRGIFFATCDGARRLAACEGNGKKWLDGCMSNVVTGGVGPTICYRPFRSRSKTRLSIEFAGLRQTLWEDDVPSHEAFAQYGWIATRLQLADCLTKSQ